MIKIGQFCPSTMGKFQGVMIMVSARTSNPPSPPPPPIYLTLMIFQNIWKKLLFTKID